MPVRLPVAVLVLALGTTCGLVALSVSSRSAAPPPARLGPAEPITAGPITAGPITAGPITAGPVTAGPVTAGPVTAGPITAEPITAPPVALRPDALAVLHAWDRRRASAWATGDVAALSRLYLPSRAGAADVALLRRYCARGLVVRGMRMQVLRARVLRAGPRVLELEVTDRLADAAALDAELGARRLPADAASTHVLTLRRVGGQWLMARVADPRSPAGRR